MIVVDKLLPKLALSPVLVFFLLFWGLFEGQMITVKRYRLPAPAGLEESVRLVFVSDTHTGRFCRSGRMERIGHRIERLDPDVLLLGGDYVLGYQGDPDNLFLPLLTGFPSEKVFAVTGNHDHMEGIGEIRAAMERCGIRELNGTAIRLPLGGISFNFTGTADWEYTRSDPAPVIDILPEESQVVFITHNPDTLLNIRQHPAPDLALAGHTHGGQITFFGLRALYLNTSSGEELRTGLNGEGAFPVIVSNGVGLSGFPFRFFAPPQIVVVDYSPANN